MRGTNYYYRRTFGDYALIAFFVAIVVIVIGVIGAGVTYVVKSYHYHQTLTCTVTDKDRSSDGKTSNVRIYTKQCGVLTVEDAMWIGRFDSADDYAKIDPGHTYVFETIGYRVRFLSDFPNIINIKKVK